MITLLSWLTPSTIWSQTTHLISSQSSKMTWYPKATLQKKIQSSRRYPQFSKRYSILVNFIKKHQTTHQLEILPKKIAAHHKVLKENFFLVARIILYLWKVHRWKNAMTIIRKLSNHALGSKALIANNHNLKFLLELNPWTNSR